MTTSASVNFHAVWICFHEAQQLPRLVQALSFFFSSRRRHTRYWRDWSSDVCSSDLVRVPGTGATRCAGGRHRRFVQRLASERHADDSAERWKVGEGTHAATRTLRIPVRGGRRVGGRPDCDRAYPESVRHGERGAGGCGEQVTCGGASCECFTRHAAPSPITEIINVR